MHLASLEKELKHMAGKVKKLTEKEACGCIANTELHNEEAL